MSLKRQYPHITKDVCYAKGLFSQDWEALHPAQRECIARIASTKKIEQEAYMTNHPEVPAMFKMIIANFTSSCKSKSLLPDIAMYFTRPVDEIVSEIKEYLKVDGPPFVKKDRIFSYTDEKLDADLVAIMKKYEACKLWEPKDHDEMSTETLSSTFLSVKTSATTLPTPEPEPTPEPTLEQIMANLVSNTVDKAVYMHVNRRRLLYDTAYVELKKAVERAMEIPVILIRKDINALYEEAMQAVDEILDKKADEIRKIAWEKRMRKKLKHALRLHKNFRGYETPVTPKSIISSHDSYKEAPQRPCPCCPRSSYNRYRKDRFGVYLPIYALREHDGQNAIETPAESCINYHRLG